MSVQIEKLEKNMIKLTIEVSEGEVEKALQTAYLKNKGKINLPGFRKGKVPRAMIEKMYGVEMFYEDAANEMIPGAYDSALEEVEQEVVSRPSIDVVQIEKGKPFIFTAEIAVKPGVTLGEYKEVEIEKIDTEVTEEDINAEIDKEREKNSRTVPVEDRPVQDKDETVIDFEGFVDGVAFEGGVGTDYPLVIGSHSFIDTFEEQLIGANIGEEKEINVTFPAEYHAAELAGKPALFKVTVKAIKEKELPEMDDEFAKDVSEFNTLAEYKEDVKVQLQVRKEKESKTAKEDAVINKIIDNAQMEIPEPMIETQVRQIADDFSRRITSQGLTMEQYFQFTGLTAEKMLEQMRPQAVKRIQSRLVLEAIVKAENMEVSEDEINEEMNKMAETYKMELDQVKEMIGDKEKEMMKLDIAIQKAVTLVSDCAKEV